MSKKVIILGGGVAGMSAAHELIDRGYQVEVFEKNPIYVGGKARSVDYYGDEAVPYQNPLPGEHGFRFFPGFYKHVTETMTRIPYGKDSNCYENLVASKTAMMASFGKPELLTLVNFPKSLGDLELMLDTFIEASEIFVVTQDENEINYNPILKSKVDNALNFLNFENDIKSNKTITRS